MQEKDDISTSEEGINLKELFKIVWEAKGFVVLVSFLFFAFSVYYVKSLPDSYSAYGTYLPSAESEVTLSSGGLGDMARMAGLNIPVSENDKVTLAIEILRSRKFLRDLILQKEFLPNIGWNLTSDEVAKMPKEEKEELLQSATASLSGTFRVSKPRASTIVRIYVNSGDPLFAKQLVEWLIEGVNKTMAEDDVIEAKKSIEYLKTQASKTSVSDLKKLFYGMIESHVTTIMLAEVNKEYVFKTLDPPVLPIWPTGINKLKIVIWISLAGLVSSIGLLLLVFYLGYQIVEPKLFRYTLRKI